MSLTMFNKPPTETQSIASDRPSVPAYTQFRPMPPPTAITIQPLPRPMETFEVNALVCNVIALVCMPCACACAIPGLLCGMAAYVEYRVFDTMAYLRRLRWSRNLAIASTIFGLICMVSIAVVIYLHYNEIKRYLKPRRSRYA